MLYNKSEYAPLSREEVTETMRANMFATMVTSGPEGPVASHLPFIIDPARGDNGTLISHLASANMHSDLIRKGLPSVVIFQGAHGYISSSWYPRNPRRDSAPTWHYAVVHCRGRPVPIGRKATVQHLADLVGWLERDRTDAWELGELGPGGMGRRLPHILAFEMPIDRLEAKFKMGQDERAYDTAAAIRVLDEAELPLAELMKRYNADRTD